MAAESKVMRLDGRRIVTVEDDPRNRKLVQMLLTTEGARIWFAR
jgi:CheY-like chemotaxis protein